MTATAVVRAWSCDVRLVVDDDGALDDAADDMIALLDRVDRAASRFRADSELSVANERAGKPVAVSRLLVELVSAALEAAADTGGAVDPTVGESLRALGYDRDIALVPATGSAVPAHRPAADWRAVRLDPHVGLLTVPPGTTLDLGATAKAFAADLIARGLNRRYRTAVLVELGGDIAMCGHRSDGWRIEVAERAGDAGQHVVVHTGGLTTSTTTVRHWTRGGSDVHHIVDPRTGASAAGPWRTVSVVAPSAVAANTASTAAIVLGEQAPTWLRDRGVAARLVSTHGAVHTVGGWPAPVAIERLAGERQLAERAIGAVA